MLRISEEVEEGQFPRPPVPLQGLEDGLRREPLVDEERQRGHVEGEPLGFARPVQERPAQRFELLRGRLGLIEALGLYDGADERFALFTRGVLAVPIEGWRE